MDENQKALEWANSNPDDPRAEKVRAKVWANNNPNDPRSSKILAKLSAPKPEEISELESGVRGAAQGASFNFADEIAGGLAAIPTALQAPFSDKIGWEDVIKKYQEERDESRQAYDAAREANPASYFGGELAGGVGTMFIPGVGLAAKAAGAGIKGGAALGAGYGAISGLGGSEATDVAGMAKDVAVGAGLGGVVGAAVPAVAKGIKKVAGLTDEFVLKGELAERLKDSYEMAGRGKHVLTKAGRAEIQQATRADTKDLVTSAKKLINNYGTTLTNLKNEMLKENPSTNIEATIAKMKEGLNSLKKIKDAPRLEAQISELEDYIARLEFGKLKPVEVALPPKVKTKVIKGKMSAKEKLELEQALAAENYRKQGIQLKGGVTESADGRFLTAEKIIDEPIDSSERLVQRPVESVMDDIVAAAPETPSAMSEAPVGKPLIKETPFFKNLQPILEVDHVASVAPGKTVTYIGDPVQASSKNLTKLNDKVAKFYEKARTNPKFETMPEFRIYETPDGFYRAVQISDPIAPKLPKVTKPKTLEEPLPMEEPDFDLVKGDNYKTKASFKTVLNTPGVPEQVVETVGQPKIVREMQRERLTPQLAGDYAQARGASDTFGDMAGLLGREATLSNPAVKNIAKEGYGGIETQLREQFPAYKKAAEDSRNTYKILEYLGFKKDIDFTVDPITNKIQMAPKSINKPFKQLYNVESESIPGFSASERLTQAMNVLKGFNPELANSLETKVRQSAKDFDYAQMARNFTITNPATYMKGGIIRAGNFAGQMTPEIVKKGAAGAMNLIKRASSADLASMSEDLMAKGGVSAKLGRVLQEASKKDNIGRNALIFSLAQNPEFRQEMEALFPGEDNDGPAQ